jgi:hypothetical protein
MRRGHVTPGLVSAILALTGCGVSAGPDEKKFEALEASCAAQPGAAYSAAATALQGGYPVGPVCSAALLPISSTDACGAASDANEVCQVLYYWFTADPSVCAPGYCACELRLLKNDIQARQGGATVCAARFLRGQPSP